MTQRRIPQQTTVDDAKSIPQYVVTPAKDQSGSDIPYAVQFDARPFGGGAGYAQLPVPTGITPFVATSDASYNNGGGARPMQFTVDGTIAGFPSALTLSATVISPTATTTFTFEITNSGGSFSPSFSPANLSFTGPGTTGPLTPSDSFPLTTQTTLTPNASASVSLSAGGPGLGGVKVVWDQGGTRFSPPMLPYYVDSPTLGVRVKNLTADAATTRGNVTMSGALFSPVRTAAWDTFDTSGSETTYGTTLPPEYPAGTDYYTTGAF